MIQIRKVIKPLDLADYAKEYAGQTLQVWVNPPRSERNKLGEIAMQYTEALQADIAGRTAKALLEAKKDGESKMGIMLRNMAGFFGRVRAELKKVPPDYEAVYHQMRAAWLANLLSQGAPETHVTAAELLEHNQNDPALFEWLYKTASEMIKKHWTGEKKG